MTRQAPALSEALGHFRLERELGRGRLGVVYLAHDTQLDRPVALKLIDLNVAADEQFRTRFLSEMPRVARLDHPNIVPVLAAGEIDGRLYVAMRHVDGEDLRALLRRGGPLGVRRVAQIGLQLGTALDAAHIRGVVHGSLKPSNVLLDGGAADAPVCVSDFALALEPRGDASRQDTGELTVASGYVPPEQAAGRPATARSDVFAMGRLLFDLVTGEAFVRGGRGHATHVRLPSVGAAAGPHHARVDEVLAKACAEHPEERYASAGDLGRAFLAAVHGRGSSDEGGLGIGAALDGLPIVDEIVAVRRRSDAGRVSRSQVASRDARRPYPHVIEPESAPAAPSVRRRLVALLLFAGLVGAIVATTLAVSSRGGAAPKPAAAGSAAARRATPLSLPPLLSAPSSAVDRTGTRAVRAPHASTPAHRSYANPTGAPTTAPATPAALSCGSYTTHSITGAPIQVNTVTAVKISCEQARATIDALPSGRLKTGWECPVVGDSHAARCTHAGGQVVTWHTPSGASQTRASTHPGAPDGLPTAVMCSSFTTHASDGSPIPVNGVTAMNLGCHAARVVIDALPSGRVKTGWNCPLTGDRFFTECTNAGDRTVAWHDPSGRSQDVPAPATTADPGASVCAAFHTSDSKGVAYLATPRTLSGITCAAARATIAGGPAARAKAGWSCPVTGDAALTACTRGNERLTWAMKYERAAV